LQIKSQHRDTESTEKPPTFFLGKKKVGKEKPIKFFVDASASVQVSEAVVRGANHAPAALWVVFGLDEIPAFAGMTVRRGAGVKGGYGLGVCS
jgi:hypothetical protein